MLVIDKDLVENFNEEERDDFLQEPILPPHHRFINGFIAPYLPRKKTVKDRFHDLVWKLSVGN